MEDQILDNKVLKKYLRRVKHIYYGDKKLKKQFLLDVEDALLYYVESHPGCSYDDIVHKFGSPKELRESFASSDMLKKRSILFYRLFPVLRPRNDIDHTIYRRLCHKFL